MASSWTSATRLWRGLLCSIFPACMVAPTCGGKPRRDATTTAWVRSYLKGRVSPPSLMPRNLNFVYKVSQSLGTFQSFSILYERVFIWEKPQSTYSLKTINFHCWDTFEVIWLKRFEWNQISSHFHSSIKLVVVSVEQLAIQSCLMCIITSCSSDSPIALSQLSWVRLPLQLSPVSLCFGTFLH